MFVSIFSVIVDDFAPMTAVPSEVVRKLHTFCMRTFHMMFIATMHSARC